MTNSFGDALSDYMRRNGLTQQQVAERTGVAQPVIGRLMRSAQPEMPTIQKIAKGLQVDVTVKATGEVLFDPA